MEKRISETNRELKSPRAKSPRLKSPRAAAIRKAQKSATGKKVRLTLSLGMLFIIADVFPAAKLASASCRRILSIVRHEGDT